MKHPLNRNLTLHNKDSFLNLPLLKNHKPYILEYLQRISEICRKALKEHPRSIFIRFDLRFPVDNKTPLDEVITRFFKSLNKIIEADIDRKTRTNMKTHPCTPRYAWAREIYNSATPHYHIFLALNADTYKGLGKFDSDNENMAKRINRAWSSALDLSRDTSSGLVHFPENPVYEIDFNKPDFLDKFKECFQRASYLAKSKTKAFHLPGRNFGCSQK